MSPAQFQQTMQIGLNHHQAGRWREAEKLYKQARAAIPGQFDPIHLLGVLAYQQGRFPEAIDLLSRAFRINPRVAACEMRLGLSLAAIGKQTEAEVHLRGALKTDPTSADAWNALAFTLRVLGKVDEAAQSYRQAVALNPGFFEAHDRLGALVGDTQGLPAGMPHFRKALEINPQYAPAWGNLGLALSADRKLPDALQALDRALSLDPKLVQARVGRALVLQQLYRIPEAAAEFSRALEQNPFNHEARTGRLLTLNYLADQSREQVFAEHLEFQQALERAGFRVDPASRRFPNLRDPQRRLRVAFLSPDFRSHSVAYFIQPILQHLDRTQFEVYLYHDHFQVDAMSEKLRPLAAVWRNFVGQLHDVVETQIREDAPDILVDLTGHTGLSRLPVFARRLAPVQITYLGYPNTTGLSAMDYRFVDATTDPAPEADRFCTEKLVRFSPCAWVYQPPANAPEPGIRSATDPTISFGSFNTFAKVSDQTLALWARVLNAIPHSRLSLKAHNLPEPGIKDEIHRRLAGVGLEPHRVHLFDRTPQLQNHLSMYADVDIALDPFPYHGTTTTCEALWMGVPVVTLLGDRHASRVGASLLTTVGHPEWIAESADHYVQICQRLAEAREDRQRLRTTLRSDLANSRLMDAPAQAKAFGDALRQCWVQACNTGATV